jgi:hypothetical protein
MRTCHVPCKWEELHITCDLATAALARLPLRGIRKLEVCCVRNLDSDRATTTTAAELAAALASAPDCVFVCPGGGRLFFKCDVGQLEVLLPRWQGEAAVPSMTLTAPSTECLTPAAVEALGSLLERTPSCTELHIKGGAPPDPETSPLLPALRNTAISTVRLQQDQMTEAQLLAWCSGKNLVRPIVVVWEGRISAGGLARIRQALQESGGLVSLECDDLSGEGAAFWWGPEVPYDFYDY